MDAGDGNDTVQGGRAGDRLLGRAGNDLLQGQKHTDKIFGSFGDDTLEGGSGDDYLSGGDGNDSIKGGTGADNIEAGRGNDVIHVADGEEDSVDCSSGTDTVYVEENAPERDDLLDCEKVIPVPPELTDPGEVDESVIIGGDGNDTLNGTPGPDLMLGGFGNDSLFGLDGNDHLEGDPGDDLLDGGNGDDRLQGRKGNDSLLGGAGNDHLEGNFDNDRLDGGPGNDYLEDNLGANTFIGGDGNDYVLAANGVHDVIDCGPGIGPRRHRPRRQRGRLRGREALATRQERGCLLPGQARPKNPCKPGQCRQALTPLEKILLRSAQGSGPVPVYIEEGWTSRGHRAMERCSDLCGEQQESPPQGTEAHSFGQGGAPGAETLRKGRRPASSLPGGRRKDASAARCIPGPPTLWRGLGQDQPRSALRRRDPVAGAEELEHLAVDRLRPLLDAEVARVRQQLEPEVVHVGLVAAVHRGRDREVVDSGQQQRGDREAAVDVAPRDERRKFACEKGAVEADRGLDTRGLAELVGEDRHLLVGPGGRIRTAAAEHSVHEVARSASQQVAAERRRGHAHVPEAHRCGDGAVVGLGPGRRNVERDEALESLGVCDAGEEAGPTAPVVAGEPDAIEAERVEEVDQVGRPARACRSCRAARPTSRSRACRARSRGSAWPAPESGGATCTSAEASRAAAPAARRRPPPRSACGCRRPARSNGRPPRRAGTGACLAALRRPSIEEPIG